MALLDHAEIIDNLVQAYRGEQFVEEDDLLPDLVELPEVDPPRLDFWNEDDFFLDKDTAWSPDVQETPEFKQSQAQVADNPELAKTPGYKKGFSENRWFKTYENGKIPTEAMTDLGGGHFLRPDAADTATAMQRDAAKAGVTLLWTDTYRSYAAQVDVARRKPSLAAEPGTSKHGWGIAIDFNVNDPRALRWLRKNAARYGWENPDWAKPGGSKPEPWHWEYTGGGDYTPTVNASKSRRTRRNDPPRIHAPNFVNPADPLVMFPMSFGRLLYEPEAPRGRSSRGGGGDGSVPSFVPKNYRKHILDAAARHGLDPRLIAFVGKAESGWRNNLTSSAGAQGVMQVMPLHGLKNPFNARANIMKGAEILASYIAQAGGNIRLGLAYYNAGPNAKQSTINRVMKSYVNPIWNAYRGKS